MSLGGVSIVRQAASISEPTIRAGIRELKSSKKLPAGRCRNTSGGRKKVPKPDRNEQFE
ncbi:MAG: hypothetical protein LBT05_14240 [Planctomycetaceae bacterium]|jgi:hypothetical protein|nr:hypothetical protein [Planctomycetaceae bacterium]